MPFTLIKGKYKPGVGEPDGDSVRFEADNLELWKKLEGKPAKVSQSGSTKGTVQLRLEGIDAIEKGATKPLSVQAKDSLLKALGHSAANPTPAGYILARMTDDQSGRPICFAFAGAATEADGADVHLTSARLKSSANYKQMRAGFAYPLYYNTLFADLRKQFTIGHKQAKTAAVGYFAKKNGAPLDRTLKGVTVTSSAQLATIAPIWPKLWRRLEEHFKKPGATLAGFVAFLAAKNERLDILSLMEERGLQDIVKVQGSSVKLSFAPEDIRVVGDAGKRVRGGSVTGKASGARAAAKAVGA